MSIFEDWQMMPAPRPSRRHHTTCSIVVAASCEAKYNAHNAGSYGFANDLDLWIQCLSDRPESVLFQTASSEFVLALLNNSQGQYRNAFKGLRLVLELILQGAYLSVYPVLLSEWLRSQADTSWQAIFSSTVSRWPLRRWRRYRRPLVLSTPKLDEYARGPIGICG
jgi:hypothetical protein